MSKLLLWGGIYGSTLLFAAESSSFFFFRVFWEQSEKAVDTRAHTAMSWALVDQLVYTSPEGVFRPLLVLLMGITYTQWEKRISLIIVRRMHLHE